jgi:hypothetical protein
MRSFFWLTRSGREWRLIPGLRASPEPRRFVFKPAADRWWSSRTETTSRWTFPRCPQGRALRFRALWLRDWTRCRVSCLRRALPPPSEIISSCTRPKIRCVMRVQTWGCWRNCIPPVFASPRPAGSQTSVSRYFAPSYGIPEDPVTGSTHCTLGPYWSDRLKKGVLHTRQTSQRGGDLLVEPRGSRVTLKGKAVMYLAGAISL